MSANFEVVHYIITILFFTVFTLIVLKLLVTYRTLPENTSNNEDITKATEYLLTAIVLGFLAIFIILIGLVFIGILGFRKDFKTYTDSLQTTLKADNIYIALRIIIFSILFGTSIVVAILAAKAAQLFKDKPNYTDQYDTCYEAARVSTIHVLLFVAVQGVVYISTFLTKNILTKEQDESSPPKEQDESSPPKEQDESSLTKEQDESSPLKKKDKSSSLKKKDKSSSLKKKDKSEIKNSSSKTISKNSNFLDDNKSKNPENSDDEMSLNF
jgi:hypothetical protein